MPPKSPLPLHDGRVGHPPASPPQPHSSSSLLDEKAVELMLAAQQRRKQQQQDDDLPQTYGNEPYYSDAEIELLNEIVTLAETILPTLPEQNRLPTEALFAAAEEIFPNHGYDPDSPPSHLSRFIFKIGGHRTGETLSDKFRAVLEGMGVELEIVPTSPAGSISARSNRSSIVSRRTPRKSTKNDAPTAAVASGGGGSRPEQVPSRRHSISSAKSAFGRLSPLTEKTEFDLPIRPASTAGSGAPPSKPPSLFDYDTDAALRDALLRKSLGLEMPGGGVSDEKKARQEPVNDENNRPVNPVLRASQALAHASSPGYRADIEQHDESSQELPILPFQQHIPVMERGRKPPSSFKIGAHIGEDLSEPEERDLTTGDTEHVHPSPEEEASVHGSEQTRDDTPPPFHQHTRGAVEDIHVLEHRLHQFRVQDGQKLLRRCLHDWRFNAIITRRDNGIAELRASDFDDIDIFEEVLGIWQEEAVLSQEEKAAAQVAAEHEAYVARMEKRAQRVYEILTVRNVLSQWHESALEEIERTAIARRHLVRKRAFDGWVAQHIEDETKVQNFVLIHALQKWTQVALHLEVRKQVSVQRYERTLAQKVINTMWEEVKAQLAHEFYFFKLGQESLRHWNARAREMETEMEVAAASDDRLILYEVVDIWREEAEEQQYINYEGRMRLLAKSCLRDLEYWHEQARLQRTLKQFTAHQIFTTQTSVLSTWHRAAAQLEQRSIVANSFLLESPLTYWHHETKLQIFLSCQNHRLKSTTLTHWILEEKLAWYKRHLTNQTLSSTFMKFLTLARRSRANRARDGQDALAEYIYYTKLESVEKWLIAAANTWKPRHNANLVYLYRTTVPVIEAWKKKSRVRVDKGTTDRRAADVNARRVLVSNVLDVWPGKAERQKRERLMNTLREFRRNYKIELAEGCLEHWWEGTRDLIGRERHADGVSVESKRFEVDGWIEHWAERTVENRELAVIAEDAEVEVWMSIWQRRMEEMEELRGVAIGVDAERTIQRCWSRLEFQSLQRRAMGRSVAAVREKNDLRLCGRVLEQWCDLAIPDRGVLDETADPSVFDPRFSTLSRASLRTRETPGSVPAAARSTSALALGRTFNDNNRNVFTPAGSLLGRGGGRATTTAHRAYTRGGDGTFETPQPVQSQPPAPLPTVSQLGIPPPGSTSATTQPRTRPPRASTTGSRPLRFGDSTSLRGGPSTTPGPPPPSLATPGPATFPPMTEFDFDNDNQVEDSLLVSLTGRGQAGAGPSLAYPGDGDGIGDEDLEGDYDSDGGPPDLGFMSTPSRRLVRPSGGGGSSMRNSNLGRVAALNAATTTPSAILASPYERELRRVYGQGEGSQNLAGTGTRRPSSAQGLGLALGLGTGTQTQGQNRSRSLGPGPSFGRSLGRGSEGETPRRGAGGGGAGGGRSARVVEFADIREESAEL